MLSLNCAESQYIGHAHFCLPFFFFPRNCRNVANLLFRTPPRWFHRFAWNFAHSICGLSWQKVTKRILIFQTILKLVNNNFLYILLKTRRVGCLERNGLNLFIKFWAFIWLYRQCSSRDDGKYYEREGERHAAKDLRPRLKPGPPQRGQSLCAWDVFFLSSQPLPLLGRCKSQGWDVKANQCWNQTQTTSKSHILSPYPLLSPSLLPAATLETTINDTSMSSSNSSQSSCFHQCQG